MQIRHLKLINFRNYKKIDINFLNKPTVFLAGNTAGKTNLLQAISFLASAKSSFSKREEDLINWEENFTKVLGEIEKEREKIKIEITLIKSDNKFQKNIKVNKVPKKQANLVGEFNVVLFSPEDINLISSSPGLRRRYLDALISQIDWKYLFNLNNFKKVISARNRLLSDINKKRANIDQLDFWNEKLIQTGAFIIKRRGEAINFFNKFLSSVYDKISAGGEHLNIQYLPSFDIGLKSKESVELKSISDVYRKKLQQIKEEEIKAGFTFSGPHRDDFKFILDGKDLTSFGSRGEQRSATLATKITELDFLQEFTGFHPVLLLDDIFSELDEKRRDCVLGLMGKQQTIITTTDIEHIKPQFRENIDIFRIKNGQIDKIN